MLGGITAGVPRSQSLVLLPHFPMRFLPLGSSPSLLLTQQLLYEGPS
jgi:hypothetical protein